MSRTLKLLAPCRAETAKVDVNDLLDAFVVNGGLDLNVVKKERLLGLEMRDTTYSFWFHDGRAFEGATYWIEESGAFRQYLWLEVGLSKIDDINGRAVMEFALERSRSFPSVFKIGLVDNVVVLTVRCPVDGLREGYLQEVINSFDGCGAKLFAEMHERFGLPTLLESIRDEDERSRIH